MFLHCDSFYSHLRFKPPAACPAAYEPCGRPDRASRATSPSISASLFHQPRLMRIARAGNLFAIAHRQGDVAWPHLARRAGRPGADRVTRQIQRHHQRLARLAGDRDTDGVRQPRRILAQGPSMPSPNAASCASSRSRNAANARRWASAAASSAAAPNAAIAGTFSVPARRNFSWPPPISSGCDRQIALQHQRADAQHAAHLVRRHSSTDRRPVASYQARSGPASAMRRNAAAPPAACTRSAASRTGWITPVSLFASMTETKAGRSASRSAAARSSRSTWPSTLRRAECAHPPSAPASAPNHARCRRRSAAARRGWRAPDCWPRSRRRRRSRPPPSHRPAARPARARDRPAPRAARPKPCTDDGLPIARNAASSAASAGALGGVVALASM